MHWRLMAYYIITTAPPHNQHSTRHIGLLSTKRWHIKCRQRKARLRERSSRTSGLVERRKAMSAGVLEQSIDNDAVARRWIMLFIHRIARQHISIAAVSFSTYIRWPVHSFLFHIPLTNFAFRYDQSKSQSIGVKIRVHSLQQIKIIIISSKFTKINEWVHLT